MMAGAPSVLPMANKSPTLIQGGHEGHGTPPGNANNAAFSDALNQAATQRAVNAEAGHGAYGSQETGAAGRGGHAGHDFQQRMLGVRAYRQQLLASNIVNADTPGYKAVDIDIEEVAQILQGAPASLSLATTASGHLSGGAPAPPFPLKYHVPYQAAADGNTVEMNVEREKFSENSLMYQFSLDRVSGHFKHFTELLQNLK